MSYFKNGIFILFACTALLTLSAMGGWLWATAETRPSREGGNPAAVGVQSVEFVAVQNKNQPLYWYDPMVPQQHFDKPGKSPFMDMALIPKYAEAESEGKAAGVKINSVAEQNLGVRLASVTRIALRSQVEATGILGFNERDVAIVQSRTSGFVERVWPLAPGDLVKAGQPLVEMLVPEWAAAQVELLAIATIHDAALLDAARDRLRFLGMPESLIRAVEKSGKPHPRYRLQAPMDGVVETLDVRLGMTIASGQTLVRINGLRTVWLEVALPEALAESVQIGAQAKVRLTAFPAEVISGRVTSIVPVLNAATRSLRIRVELDNADGQLRPGLSAQVTLQSNRDETGLTVPIEAILRTGKRALLMLVGEKGAFVPTEVRLGSEIGDRTVIVAGVREGQQVVASGQFLLDSEASLLGIVPDGLDGVDAEMEMEMKAKTGARP